MLELGEVFYPLTKHHSRLKQKKKKEKKRLIKGPITEFIDLITIISQELFVLTFLVWVSTLYVEYMEIRMLKRTCIYRQTILFQEILKLK